MVSYVLEMKKKTYPCIDWSRGFHIVLCNAALRHSGWPMACPDPSAWPRQCGSGHCGSWGQVQEEDCYSRGTCVTMQVAQEEHSWRRVMRLKILCLRWRTLGPHATDSQVHTNLLFDFHPTQHDDHGEQVHQTPHDEQAPETFPRDDDFPETLVIWLLW